MVIGFSTLAILNAEIDGRRLRAIYSGDTIIDRVHWGTQALAFTWLRFAGTMKAQVPDCPLYWFLIVKGHRTYRYLSAFSLDFYPHWEAPTPAWAQSIMAGLARRVSVLRITFCNKGNGWKLSLCEVSQIFKYEFLKMLIETPSLHLRHPVAHGIVSSTRHRSEAVPSHLSLRLVQSGRSA